MTVSLLHPEDLLEKDAHGKLTTAERARLDAHLADCPTCRFERQVRLDFAEELDDEVELSTQRMLAIIEGMPRRIEAPSQGGFRANDTTPPPADAPQLDAERVDDERANAGGAERADAEERPATLSTHPSRRRARRRATIAMLAAAALLVGSVATAGAGARVWARISASFSSPSEVVVQAPATAAEAPAAPPVVRARDVIPEPEEARPSDADEATATPVAAITPVSMPVRTSSPIVNLGVSPTPDDAATLFDQANDARHQGDYARAIALHRRLEALHPKSREAHVSYATVGRLLLDRGDAAGALTSFDAYQARGAGALDEAVLVGRATALERLGRVDEARSAWRALLTAFPTTPYAGHARARIDVREGTDGARLH